MKSPKQVRDDIRTLTSHLGQVQEALLKRADVTVAQIGKECKRTADVIGELLKTQQLPADYKVAVVGRFKTGKSSFVNELLSARLASEDTNPETAAITTFRHGDRVMATVRFVSSEEWGKLKALYDEDPKHSDAHRVKMWNSFRKPRKSKDGEGDESFDLPALERQFLKPGGHRIEIALAADGTKKSETEFRRRLKEFTSGAKPHHSLVQAIEIAAPAAILDEGVLLIDTPGLDDTERFRVSLTEKTVDDVDAILFLTKSGESYSQSDKDFLLSLLRKGTVKQLIVVITQVDVTYQQHLDNAEANDEEPESLGQRIKRERQRIARELATTLAELSQDDTPAMRRYREQLGDIEIAFTSAKLHRDWLAKKPTICAVSQDDPGGVEKLKHQLLRMLSTESRLAMAARSIAAGTRTALLDLQSVLDAKLLAIRDIKDREVAEQKLRNFRAEFGQAGERFEASVNQRVTVLEEQLETRRVQHATLVEHIALLAERELGDSEMSDISLSWQARRFQHWGSLTNLQIGVANRIFPKVQQMLSDYSASFADFAHSFEVYLNALSAEGARIANSLEIGATLPFDVTPKLKESLERSLQRAQDLISGEEQVIVSMLDNFVTDEVAARIDEARRKVSDVWGTGTTRGQSVEVRNFYRELKALLSEALVSHLHVRRQEFGDFLVAEAKTAPRDALEEVTVLLEQAADNIRAAAAAMVAGQREVAESLIADVKQDHQAVLTRAQNLLALEAPPAPAGSRLGDLLVDDAVPPRPAAPPMAPVGGELAAGVAGATATATATAANAIGTANSGADEPDGDWAEQVLQQATVVVERLRLKEDSTGWPFDKLFAARFLQGAQRVRLIDPYLAKHHQIRNLNDFLLHVAETARPKEIEIVTAYAPEQFASYQDRAVDNAATDLFKNYGVTLSLRRATGLHDRCLVLDHGVLFKLGRGLDIYKPAVGLAEHRAANRKVRQTEVDVFCRQGHALQATPGASAT